MSIAIYEYLREKSIVVEKSSRKMKNVD